MHRQGKQYPEVSNAIGAMSCGRTANDDYQAEPPGTGTDDYGGGEEG